MHVNVSLVTLSTQSFRRETQVVRHSTTEQIYLKMTIDSPGWLNSSESSRKGMTKDRCYGIKTGGEFFHCAQED